MGKEREMGNSKQKRQSEQRWGTQACSQRSSVGVLVASESWLGRQMGPGSVFHHPQEMCGASGKEPACQCRRHKRCRFNPWVRKIF